MMLKARSAMLMLGLLTLGCDPCGDLDAKICSDLGAADCQIWNNQLAELRSGYLGQNDRRMTSRWQTCNTLADEPTYSTRILPSVQNAVTQIRTPGAPLRPVATGAPEGGSGAGLWMLMPLLIGIGYFAYYKFVMPKQRAAVAAKTSDLNDAQARARAELQAMQDQNKGEDR